MGWRSSPFQSFISSVLAYVFLRPKCNKLTVPNLTCQVPCNLLRIYRRIRRAKIARIRQIGSRFNRVYHGPNTPAPIAQGR
ncbi:hypothetical protein F4859DRAFT_485394 [Xylaria cf. heliscus]|nr:hypothetical protein F4859DRAFT_485394 [Xylaria cf. heliscus]